MAWSIVSPQIGSYQAIDEVSTTQKHPFGFRVWAEDPTYGVAEFVYVKGVASVIATDWCTIAEDWALVRLVADAVGNVCIAMAAIDAATDYGWGCIYANTIAGGSGGAITDGAKIYAHGTAGLVDDAVVDGDMVHNAITRSTISGAAITGRFQIYYPYNDDIAGND